MTIKTDTYSARQVLDIGVRNNRFTVTHKLPISIPTDIDSDFFTYHTKAANITMGNNSEAEIKRYGKTFTRPRSLKYDPLEITYLVDKKWKVKSLMDKWFLGANSPKTNTKAKYKNYIANTQITIDQYDIDDNIIATYIYKELYPTAISDIQLSQTDYDQFEEFTVTYKYSDLDIE